jgi:hypothetical protein
MELSLLLIALLGSNGNYLCIRDMSQLSERRLVSCRLSCNVTWQRKISNRLCKQQGYSAMHETDSDRSDLVYY